MMDLKILRVNFRNAVLKRDGMRCVMCGDASSKLEAHHITEMPNGGYSPLNGITLCDKPDGCHLKAEKRFAAWRSPNHSVTELTVEPIFA